VHLGLAAGCTRRSALLLVAHPMWGCVSLHPSPSAVLSPSPSLSLPPPAVFPACTIKCSSTSRMRLPAPDGSIWSAVSIYKCEQAHLDANLPMGGDSQERGVGEAHALMVATPMKSSLCARCSFSFSPPVSPQLRTCRTQVRGSKGRRLVAGMMRQLQRSTACHRVFSVTKIVL